MAGLLLTGGNSRRMGADKARLLAPGNPPLTMAVRTAGMLSQVARVCLEVGPGASGLERVVERTPGAGPLAAVSAGAAALAQAGWAGPALVVATDLPLLDLATLRWLAGYPAAGSVVPVAGGRPQPLCARWSAADLALCRRLVDEGQRAMGDLLAAAGPLLADPGAPGGPGTGPLADADTPADAARLGLLPAAEGHR